MSRDFKQEYTNYINDQTPDLWDRIEANLSAKPLVVNSNENEPHTNESVTSVIDLQDRKSKAKGKKISSRMISYGMTAVAAVVICVVVLPFAMSNMGNAESADMAQNEGIMMAMDMREDDMAVAEEECAVEGDVAHEYSANQDTGATGSMVMQSSGNSESTGTTNEELGGVSNTDNAETDGVSADAAKTVPEVAEVVENEAVKETREETSDAVAETISEIAANIEIRKVTMEDDVTLYTVALNADDGVHAETALAILSETLSGKVTLEEGNTYQVVMQTAGDDTAYEYVIIEIKE